MSLSDQIIQPAQVVGAGGSGASSLSANEIAIALGYASAAAMAAATEAGELVAPVTTAGTSTAYTLTDTRIGTPVDGQVFALRIHTLNGAAPTLAVNGSTARSLVYRTWAGVLSGVIPQYLISDAICIVAYRAAGPNYEVIAGHVIHAASIPSTLNATTFPGITLTGYSAQITGAAGYATLDLNSNVGARLLYSGGYGFLSDGGTAKITNGTVRFECGDNGVVAVSPVVSVGTSFTTVCAVAGNQSLIVATVTGIGSILLEWNGSTLTKLAGVATLVVAGSAGAGETAFRVSGGNLQAIVDTGTRNVSSGFSVRH